MICHVNHHQKYMSITIKWYVVVDRRNTASPSYSYDVTVIWCHVLSCHSCVPLSLSCLRCFRDFRALVIDMVLATDMSFHFQQIKNMKNLISLPDMYVCHHRHHSNRWLWPPAVAAGCSFSLSAVTTGCSSCWHHYNLAQNIYWLQWLQL